MKGGRLLAILAGLAPGIGVAQPSTAYGPTQSLPSQYFQSPQRLEADSQVRRRERPWTFTPSLGLLETVTNNVELTPRDQRQWDAVTQITPGLFIDGAGEYTSLRGAISVPVVLYARTGDENNKVYPNVNLIGDVALFDKVLHVEGAVSVQQQFFTPFGAQPTDLANATNNRYRTETYSISPYIKGVAGNGVAYELRNNNVWTNLSGAPISVSDQEFYQVLGVASYTQSQLGWRANFDVSNTIFSEQNKVYLRLVRGEPVWSVTPQLRLSASIGYEDNEYQFTSSRDAIYGLGVEWHPTDRTLATARWEHRFFGASYLVSLAHRTPRAVFNVALTRNITTYPEQLGTLTPGLAVDAMLNQLFRSRIPDATERGQFVEQFITDRGLPAVLATPVVLYGERILLQQSQTASAAFIGARNTIVFTVFNVMSEPIAGSGNPLPPILAAANNNTQTGGSIVWTHNLAPKLLFTASVEGSRTSANAPFVGTTNQGIVNFLLSSPLGPQMTVFGGARYQTLSSDLTNDYTEAAAFVGLRYLFK